MPVAAGERLTERQALEALLLPSADNMAWILARWDAGSQAAFVARMNATARRLGMTGTSYTDPSGLDSSTTSTAADQVRLGMAAMRVPVLATIAAMPTAVVPVAGVVRNSNTLLGQDGIAGLKTGSTQAAGGCVLIAAWHKASGHRTLIVAAAFGQPGTAETILPNALQAGHNLVLTLDRALRHGPVTAGCDRPVTVLRRSYDIGAAWSRVCPTRMLGQHRGWPTQGGGAIRGEYDEGGERGYGRARGAARNDAEAMLTVDLAAVAANTRFFASRTKAEVMAVVKADGFGHGSSRPPVRRWRTEPRGSG